MSHQKIKEEAWEFLLHPAFYIGMISRTAIFWSAALNKWQLQLEGSTPENSSTSWKRRSLCFFILTSEILAKLNRESAHKSENNLWFNQGLYRWICSLLQLCSLSMLLLQGFLANLIFPHFVVLVSWSVRRKWWSFEPRRRTPCLSELEFFEQMGSSWTIALYLHHRTIL